MNKAKKIVALIILLTTILLNLAACDNSKPTSYYLNNDGNLIVVLSNGEENNLGAWGEELILSLKSVTVSTDGYYVINGIKTNIASKIASSYSIDSNGHLIVKYTDDSTTDLGVIGDSLVNGISEVKISDDGYYVINSVKTDIVATNVYTVSFDTGFSTNLQDQKIKEGHKIDAPSITRTGYEFDGWFFNNEVWSFNSNIVTDDMTLTAKWHAKSYSLVFDEDGGESVTDINVTYDSNYSLPSTSKALYTFDGWMLNNQVINSTGVWKNDGDETITLKAKWTRTTHNVIFDSNGGASVQNLVVNSYSQIDSLPTPEWTDHTFLGWVLNNEVVELPLQMNDSDIRLLASWKGVTDDFEFTDESDNTIKITKYIGTGSNVTIPQKISNKTVKTLAENTFDGCDFVTSVVLPATLTEIEYMSLYGCSSLQSLTISGDAIGSIKYYFGNSENNVPLSFKELTFAEGSTTYSKDIFDGLSEEHLFKVNLPASVTATPTDAFFKCNNIFEVFIPNGVKSISTRTFANCSNLEKVNIPSTVTSIGMNCFINLDKLSYLVVPKSVTSFDHASLAATSTLILFERTEKLSSSSVFSIYEDEMDIYYGFEEIKSNDTFVYALCKVGSIKQAIIISLVDGASMPESIPDTLDGYPVVLNRIQSS